MPQINSAGLALLEQFEGCKLTAYQDPVGIWTIGYGHTGPDVRPGMTITKEEAQSLLMTDVGQAESCVNGGVSRNATPNEFAAMVSFAYNIGCKGFLGSTLLKLFNDGDSAGAANEFTKWVYADGIVLAGLEKRRQAERALFMETA